MIEITISSDPLSIGPSATTADLERFGAALASHLADEFGCRVRCRLASVIHSSAGSTDGEYDLAARVAERLREIESGDEWTRLVDA